MAGLLAGLLSSCKSRNEITYSLRAEDNVEAIWKIIDERYCYVEEKACDWNKVGEEYRLRAKELDARHLDSYEHQIALFDLLAGMLDSLQDGHVNLYTSFDISTCKSWYEGYPVNFSSMLQAKYLGEYRVAGSIKYNMYISGTDSIGYLYIGSFSSAFSDGNMAWIMRQMKDCRGLIVDVRNNGGGDLELARQTAGYFFRETRTVGYWQHKTGSGHEDFSKETEMTIETNTKVQWQKPVVILCNRYSYSATNFFVSAMRQADRAKTVGGITGGGGGMPLSYELPCGWTVRFSSVRMTDLNHISIEPGVKPDYEVTLTSSDKDDIIEYAIELLRPKK